MANTDSFLGTGWSFPPTFSKAQKGVQMITEEEDIQSSLRILLGTRVGERIMQPKYGCNLERLLFEPLDTTLTAYMKDLIKTSILYFEPRIILRDIVLTPNQNEGMILITIIYTVAGTNTRSNFVYPFYLQEGTEL